MPIHYAARILSGAACLLFLSLASDLQAQDRGSEHLKTFIFSAAHQQMVKAAFSKFSPDVFTRCPWLVSKGSSIAIVRPVSFDANGQFIAGTWKESYPVSGCGNDTVLHVYFFVNKDRKVETFITAPGQSRADPTLQKDATFYAVLGAATAAKTCKTFNIRDTKFEGADTANGKLRSWRETWTMIGCGRMFDVPLTFSPDERGGTNITQRLNDVTERK